MLTRNHVAFFLLLIAVPAWSQVQEPGQQQQEAGQQSSVVEETPVTDQGAPVPMPVDTAGASLAFSSEQARTNYLQGGVGLGASYDDNALNSDSNHVGAFSYSVTPHIVWDQSTSRLRWTFDYAAGLIVNQRLSERNQASHALGVDLQYRLSPHVKVGVHDHFSITTGFFDQLQGNATTPPVGVLQQPNSSVITPLATRTGNLGMADIIYQFGAGSVIGASGSFYTSRYGTPPQGTATLVDTTTEAADGFYSHRFSPRNWSGVDYRFQRLTFQPGTDGTVTHSLLFFHTIYLQPHMLLSVYAGPEYSELDSHTITTVVVLPRVLIVSLPVSNNQWSVAAGASYGWQGEHTSAQVSAARRVSDGGGLLEAVQLNNVSGALRRQLTRSSTLGFGAGYAQSNALGNSSTAANSLKTASGNVSWERRLGANLGLGLGYAREYQQGVTVKNRVDHNRGWVSISYDFSRPIGR